MKIADIVAYDRNGNAILLVKVKARTGFDLEQKEQAIAQIKRYLLEPGNYFQATTASNCYIMLVDLKTVQVFRWNGSDLEPLQTLELEPILRHYDPEFGDKPIYGFYLSTLVEGWLRDLAYRWKFELPPAATQIEAIGLLKLLAEGTTRSEVKLDNLAVC